MAAVLGSVALEVDAGLDRLLLGLVSAELPAAAAADGRGGGGGGGFVPRT